MKATQLLRRDGSVLLDSRTNCLADDVQKALDNKVDLSGIVIDAKDLFDGVCIPDLRAVNFSKARLVGCICRKVDFSHSIFDGCDGSDGNLEHSTFSHCSMRGSEFTEANFRKAKLDYCDLRQAKLRGADLRCAFLRNSDLRGADLCHARLDSSASLKGANLAGANLTGEVWEEYLNDFLPSFLTSGGRPLAVVADSWNCHTWESCPMAVAFGISSPEFAPESIRRRVNQFVQLYDLGLIPQPKVNGVKRRRTSCRLVPINA